MRTKSTILMLFLLTSLITPFMIQHQPQQSITIAKNHSNPTLEPQATTPTPPNPSLYAYLYNEANTTVNQVSPSQKVGNPIEVNDINEKTVPTINTTYKGTFTSDGDLWANDSNNAVWSAVNETGNLYWSLNQSLILDLDNYNISQSNVNWIHFTVRSYAGLSPDTNSSIRLLNYDTNSWTSTGWTVTNSEQEFTKNYTDPQTYFNTENRLEMNTLLNDSTDTSYDYNIDQAEVMVNYGHNITVNSLDFRQRKKTITVKRETSETSLDFTMNASLSNMNYLNWTIKMSQVYSSRFTNSKRYNETSNAWTDVTTVKDVELVEDGTTIANITDKAAKAEQLKTTIENVQVPSFRDEHGSDVVWTKDLKKEQGVRKRTYKVKNNAELVLENLTWTPKVPDSAITKVKGANKTASLTIKGVAGKNVETVEATYRTTAAIVINAKDQLTKRALSGGRLAVNGPGDKQYARGDFENGKFEARTLPPGTYDVNVEYTAWGHTYEATFTIDLLYGEIQSQGVTFLAPPLWLVALIGVALSTIIALLWYSYRH